MNLVLFLIGLGSTLGIAVLFYFIFQKTTVRVHDEMTVLFFSFGKLVKSYTKPGLHMCWQRILPWTRVVKVSNQKKFHEYNNISINDTDGTNLFVDLWVEYRVFNATKALFEVEDWEESLRSRIVHSATDVLCARSFQDVLLRRELISDLLKTDVNKVVSGWGIEVTAIFIKNLSLPAEVSKRLLTSVSAHLEHTKALIEEEGRIAIEKLYAQTEKEVAELNAIAKSQYAISVGNSLSNLKKDAQVLTAYEELYYVSRLNPSRILHFQGFGESLRAVDAAMISPSVADEVREKKAASM